MCEGTTMSSAWRPVELFSRCSTRSLVHLVKERSTVLELVDVNFFHRSTDEFLASVFGRFPNTIVFSASLMHGFRFFSSTTVAFLSILLSHKPRR